MLIKWKLNTHDKRGIIYLNKPINRQKWAVNALPAGDVKKLKGKENCYRLRVGNIRILFEKCSDKVHVFKIDNRGDVYKK